MLKLLILDMDGLMLDTEQLYFSAFQRYATDTACLTATISISRPLAPMMTMSVWSIPPAFPIWTVPSSTRKSRLSVLS